MKVKVILLFFVILCQLVTVSVLHGSALAPQQKGKLHICNIEASWFWGGL